MFGLMLRSTHEAAMAEMLATIKKEQAAVDALDKAAALFKRQRDEARAELAGIKAQRMANLAKAQAANAERRAAKMADVG